jgi:hypothetical protein
VETGRVALIRYVASDGTKCVGSGLLVTNLHVLTADHVASGSEYRVSCVNREFTVAGVLRSHSSDVDLAVLTLTEPAGVLGRLPCARLDRSQVGQVTACVAIGFPRWKKVGEHRQAAQVDGTVPTAEGLESTADAGLRAGFLTLVGNRILGNPPALDVDLLEESGSQWGGMSGAVVVVSNLVLGVVRSHNLAAGGQSLTVTPLTALEHLPARLRQQFWKTLGVTDPSQLPLLPDASKDNWADLARMILSPDVQDTYRPTLSSVMKFPDLSAGWTLDQLTELRQSMAEDGQGVSKVADTLTALCEALTAKPVFLAVGGSRLEAGQLQVTYRREIGAWPRGNSADALLVEAASVGIAERRRHKTTALGALARYVVGVAAALGSAPQESEPMKRWMNSLGHQLADAQAHYNQRQENPAWLVIDFGDEPQRGATAWPNALSWTLLAKDDEMTGDPVFCEATADGLRQGLIEIFRLAPPARPLLVDLAVPRALMDEGIEHWPLLEVDGTAEPLSHECHPRLRWSRRRRDTKLYNRLLDRIGQASWDGQARQWMRNDPRRACFLGGPDLQSGEDLLRVLLREGCGFAIWFPSGLPGPAVGQITKAVRKVPVLARRSVLPDQLPDLTVNRPVIIWDDPQGRGKFQLPPLVVPESP